MNQELRHQVEIFTSIMDVDTLLFLLMYASDKPFVANKWRACKGMYYMQPSTELMEEWLGNLHNDSQHSRFLPSKEFVIKWYANLSTEKDPTRIAAKSARFQKELEKCQYKHECIEFWASVSIPIRILVADILPEIGYSLSNPPSCFNSMFLEWLRTWFSADFIKRIIQLPIEKIIL